ncbi:hypothetical protein OIV83_000493 [Microbotryomycetes sp. JL201]|nr:hypothetical protein OIV83_000493 [Microbotryomycetes sp. JL201]
MPRTADDRTREFREAVDQRQHKYANSVKKHRQQLARQRPNSDEPDAWTRQAEQIATNLRSFAQFLHSIRRAYLDLNASSSAQQQQQQQQAQHAGSAHTHANQRQLDPAKGLQAWEGVKWLSDRERDEIDYGVKVALRKSVERVRQLEGLEKARVAHASRVNPNAGLTRMLGLGPTGPDQTLAAIASHRTFVTLHLNNMLAHVSEMQRQQQELRIKRTLERTATLSSGGAAATGMDELGRKMAVKARQDFQTSTQQGHAKGKSRERNQVGQVPSIYKPNIVRDQQAFSFDDDNDDEDDNGLGGDAVGSLELTEQQILQFEAEESALLRATRTDLQSLKNAESSLLEIASLQSQLAMHLTQQAELTDKLWEEAVAVTGSIEDGNMQLKKAKERNRESRFVLLFFLLLSSATLLFLDYYS